MYDFNIKNVYIDKLGDIVKNYNNTYYRNIKMKLVDVKSKTYINFSKKNNCKDPKFKVGNYVRISKYKNIFVKGYISNCSEEVFFIKKVKDTVPWTYFISYLNGEEIILTFYEFRLEKKRKNDYMLNGKVMINHLIVRLIKKILLNKNELFSETVH